ncbi:MAG: hypothetical protein IJ846_05000 [Alphaproteobacteria bacterium]|nr:hypothetical protein [Alphaproteobacteria bacterium]
MLYSYILKPNDVLINGIKAPILIDEKRLAHYAARAESEKKEQILAYLETVFSGRSRAVSCLTEKVPDLNSRKLQGFKALRECFSFSSRIIKEPHIVEAVWCVENGTFRQVGELDFSSLAWKTIRDDDNVFFAKIRHYMLVLKQGYIPPEYVKRASE